MKFLNLLIFLFSSFSFFSCSGSSESDTQNLRPKSGPSSTSSENVSSFWPLSRFPLNLYVSDAFYSDEAQVIRDMSEAWSSSIGDKINFIDSSFTTGEKGAPNLSDYKDARIGIYRLREWPDELPKSVLGVTRITGFRRNSGGENEYIEIDHADILVNYEIFQFTLDDSWGYSLQSLVLHEVGHLLGLDHDFSSSEETVMYPYLSRHTKHYFPTTRDIAAIKTKYGVGSLAANPSTDDDNEVGDKVILIHEIGPDGCDRV